MEKMSAQKTTEVLNSFYEDNLSFWQKEQERTGDVQRKPEELALNDVRSITTNPYSPNGSLLDGAAKEEWLSQKTTALHIDPYEEALVIQENNGLTSNKVEWNNETFLTHLKNNNPKEFEEFLALKDMYDKESERSFSGPEINTGGDLKKELDGLKNENRLLQRDKEKLQSKFNTVEKFFNQDKSALKSFNQFLSDEKSIDSPELKEKELVSSKKKESGLEL